MVMSSYPWNRLLEALFGRIIARLGLAVLELFSYPDPQSRIRNQDIHTAFPSSIFVANWAALRHVELERMDLHRRTPKSLRLLLTHLPPSEHSLDLHLDSCGYDYTVTIGVQKLKSLRWLVDAEQEEDIRLELATLAKVERDMVEVVVVAGDST